MQQRCQPPVQGDFRKANILCASMLLGARWRPARFGLGDGRCTTYRCEPSLCLLCQSILYDCHWKCRVALAHQQQSIGLACRVAGAGIGGCESPYLAVACSSHLRPSSQLILCRLTSQACPQPVVQQEASGQVQGPQAMASRGPVAASSAWSWWCAGAGCVKNRHKAAQPKQSVLHDAACSSV
jgi:hypothetical protein